MNKSEFTMMHTFVKSSEKILSNPQFLQLCVSDPHICHLLYLELKLILLKLLFTQRTRHLKVLKLLN